MENKLPPYDSEQVETAISEEIRKEKVGEPGYDLVKAEQPQKPEAERHRGMNLETGLVEYYGMYYQDDIDPYISHLCWKDCRR